MEALYTYITLMKIDDERFIKNLKKVINYIYSERWEQVYTR